MEIKSLKDLKVSLDSIPEVELDLLGVNYHDEGEEVQLLCFDADADPVEKWNEIEEKYPQVLEINKWIKAIINQGIKAYKQEIGDDPIEDMISSKDIKD